MLSLECSLWRKFVTSSHKFGNMNIFAIRVKFDAITLHFRHLLWKQLSTSIQGRYGKWTKMWIIRFFFLLQLQNFQLFNHKNWNHATRFEFFFIISFYNSHKFRTAIDVKLNFAKEFHKTKQLLFMRFVTNSITCIQRPPDHKWMDEVLFLFPFFMCIENWTISYFIPVNVYVSSSRL